MLSPWCNEVVDDTVLTSLINRCFDDWKRRLDCPSQKRFAWDIPRGSTTGSVGGATSIGGGTVVTTTVSTSAGTDAGTTGAVAASVEELELVEQLGAVNAGGAVSSAIGGVFITADAGAGGRGGGREDSGEVTMPSEDFGISRSGNAIFGLETPPGRSAPGAITDERRKSSRRCKGFYHGPSVRSVTNASFGQLTQST